MSDETRLRRLEDRTPYQASESELREIEDRLERGVNPHGVPNPPPHGDGSDGWNPVTCLVVLGLAAFILGFAAFAIWDILGYAL